MSTLTGIDIGPLLALPMPRTLEESGLLARGRLEDDRRRQSLALTEQGRRALRSAQTKLRDRLAGLLADLPPPEADALAGLLERLQASLSGTPPPPRPRRPPPPGAPKGHQHS